VSVRILVGDARAVLAELPAESVHCVVTSPPYWGLRDYGLPPTVWGGEDPGCAHAWGEEQSPRGRSRWEFFNDYRQPGYNNRAAAGKTGWVDDATNASGHGAFCPCGAWRGALGLEPDPALYVAHLVEVFRAVRRVLRNDGTVWCNLGDSYASGEIGRNDDDPGNLARRAARYGTGTLKPGLHARQQSRPETGLKPKDLVGIPWRVAFALQADGWWLRSEIIWHKPNPMPESVTDRPTKAHEQLFLLAKQERYYFDAEAIREPLEASTLERSYAYRDPEYVGPKMEAAPDAVRAKADWHGKRYVPAGRNKRSVWTIPSAPFPEAHFATFPAALVEPCVQAGTSERGACPACGAPWRRAVERTGYAVTDGFTPKMAARIALGLQHGPSTGLSAPGWRKEPLPTSTTLGWAPTCACAPQPVPCVVLDPFAGAGTVGLVADRLGRDAILIELKPEYAAMAERRIREDAPLLTAVEIEGETVPCPPLEPGGKALTTPRGAEGARWNQNQGRGFARPDGQPWGRHPQAEYGRRLTPKGAARTAMGLQSVRTGLHETGWQRAMAERRLQEEAPLVTAVEVEAAAPAASDHGPGPAGPEQLGLDWSEIARVDV
jgi:DNA modification methylase